MLGALTALESSAADGLVGGVGGGPPRRAATVFIFITVVMDMMALGLIIPVLPNLVASFLGGDTVRAATVYGIFGTIWGVAQFFSAPLLGALSDRFGRRPVLLLSIAGLGFDYVLMALAPSLGWLFVGRMISGVTAASVPTAFAYLADVTPAERRAQAFGLVGAAFGLGFVLGPALGGVLGKHDLRLPFWVAATFSLMNACYGWWVLPESLPRDRRHPFAWRRANPVGALRLLSAHRELLGLAGVTFLSNLAHESLPSVFVLYAGYRYGWNEQTVGLSLAAVGVCAAVVQGGLIRPFVARFGERAALFGGLGFGAAGFLVYGLAPSGGWFWLGVPLVALWGMAGPATAGLMTRHVRPSEQGQLQGANSSLRSLTGLFGPALFTTVFALFIGRWGGAGVPGAPFLLAALLLVASLAATFALGGWIERSRMVTDTNLAEKQEG